MIIVTHPIYKEQMDESNYRPWNYAEWEKLNGLRFHRVRFMIEGMVGAWLKEVFVVGTVGGLLFKPNRNQDASMSVNFKAIRSVSNAVDRGNREPNWELLLSNGARIFLDDPM